MAAKPKHFATEIELCAAFLSCVPKEWTAYNETAGWDILLVRVSDGLQIGIQAKLKFNLDVINQALEEHGGRWWSDRDGPDHRAVLVPAGEGRFGRVAAHIGLTAITVGPPQQYTRQWHQKDKWVFEPELPNDRYSEDRTWFDWATSNRCRLPEYVPDVVAGSKAPTQLTEWKINALKIIVTLELRGYVTRADFAHIGIDHRRWLTAEWLSIEDGKLVASKYTPNFKAQHPTNYEQIKADAEKWMLNHAKQQNHAR